MIRFVLLSMFVIVCFCGCSSSQEEIDVPKTVAKSPSRTNGNAKANKRILFFGNSLTAGYGLEPQQAFPALIQEKIDSLGWDFEVINAGLSGETSAGGRSRIRWLLQQPVEILVLELGANDGLRGIDLRDTEKNLQAIIDLTRAQYPKVQIVLAGMQVPPNLGQHYGEQFHALFPRLAKRNGAVLIPFLLEGVGGRPELNLPDGIHPTAAGHRLLADNVWQVLKPELVEILSQNP